MIGSELRDNILRLFVVFCLCTSGNGEGSYEISSPYSSAYSTLSNLRGVEGALSRKLVSSSSRDGCRLTSGECVYMFCASGNRDLISVDYRLQTGSDYELMFENLGRGEAGAALAGSFKKADFSAFFSHATNNSVYIDGSFTFASEVTTGAITVFTSIPGHELFMMSGSNAVTQCASQDATVLPIVLGNGLNDGSIAYAKIVDTAIGGSSSSCIQIPSGGSLNGDTFTCVSPSERPYRAEFYRDRSCTFLTSQKNISLTVDAVSHATASGRGFVSFAILLGDSHLMNPFITYVDPIVLSPSRVADDGSMSHAFFGRVLSGEVWIPVICTLALLFIIIIVTGINSWNKKIEFGDIVVYELPDVDNSGIRSLGAAVAVLDCSHGVKYRSTGRSIMLQPLKILHAIDQNSMISARSSEGLAVLGEEDGAITEVDMMRRLGSSGSRGSRPASSASSLNDELRGGLHVTALPAAPFVLSPKATSTPVHVSIGDMAAPPPPSQANIFTNANAEEDAPVSPTTPHGSTLSRVSTSPLFVHTENLNSFHFAAGLSPPPVDDVSFRPTEPTAPGFIEQKARKGSHDGKNMYVFVEDSTRPAIPYANKAFIRTLVVDLCALLYCVFIFPVLVLSSWVLPESAAVQPTESPPLTTIPSRRDLSTGNWISFQFLKPIPNSSTIKNESIVAIMSGGQGVDNFKKADLVRLNKRSFRQFLRIRRQNEDADIQSIGQLMSDKRMNSIGGSGGDLRSMAEPSPISSQPADGIKRRHGARVAKSPRSLAASSGRGPSFWSGQIQMHSMRSGGLGDEDDECLPFIREVWDEMQEEMAVDTLDENENTVGVNINSSRGDRVSSDLDFYVVRMDESIYSKLLKLQKDC